MPLLRTAALFLLVSTAALVAQTPSAYHPKKGSEILWDKFGVPHVFAKTVPDMFYPKGGGSKYRVRREVADTVQDERRNSLDEGSPER